MRAFWRCSPKWINHHFHIVVCTVNTEVFKTKDLCLDMWWILYLYRGVSVRLFSAHQGSDGSVKFIQINCNEGAVHFNQTKPTKCEHTLNVNVSLGVISIHKFRETLYMCIHVEFKLHSISNQTNKWTCKDHRRILYDRSLCKDFTLIKEPALVPLCVYYGSAPVLLGMVEWWNVFISVFIRAPAASSVNVICVSRNRNWLKRIEL